jgi:hypothetical protein
LVSQLREDLLICSSYLPLGVPNELYLQSHKKRAEFFWEEQRVGIFLVGTERGNYLAGTKSGKLKVKRTGIFCGKKEKE